MNVDKNLYRLALLWAVSLLVVFIICSNIPRNAQAAEISNSIKVLLEELNSRAKNDKLIFTIVLKDAINDEKNLTIGYGYEDIKLSIYSTEQDHFCTRHIAGDAERIECIPYNNVSYIFYTNN